MIIQFVYAETDRPGPFKVEGGFKFKCAVIPEAFASAISNAGQVIQESGGKLDSILPEFAGYRAPNVGVFMSDAEFTGLPKDFVFTANGRGTFAFGRLFTCGVNHGRPNTPFHQGFIFDAQDLSQLKAELRRRSSGVSERPIDFAFSNAWVNPRGEDEVNSVEITDKSFPYPALRQADLSHIHHQAFNATIQKTDLLESFGQSVFNNEIFTFPEEQTPLFANWVSLLTHLIPNMMAWKTLFSSISESPSQLASPDALLRIVTGQSTTQAISPSVRTWASVAQHAFEAGLDTELIAGVDQMSKLFYGAKQTGEHSKQLRSGLTPLLLSYLFMEQALFSEEEKVALADNIVEALIDIGLPFAFKSEVGRELIGQWMDSEDRLINAASQSDLFLGRLLDLQVYAGNSEGD